MIHEKQNETVSKRKLHATYVLGRASIYQRAQELRELSRLSIERISRKHPSSIAKRPHYVDSDLTLHD